MSDQVGMQEFGANAADFDDDDGGGIVSEANAYQNFKLDCNRENQNFQLDWNLEKNHIKIHKIHQVLYIF